MNPELKTKWVEALRSGSYEQGYGALRIKGDKVTGASYCCLGVLCEVNGEAKSGIGGYEIRGEGCYGIVPSGYEGLTSMVLDQLVGLNDDDKVSFMKIADYIEKEVE